MPERGGGLYAILLPHSLSLSLSLFNEALLYTHTHTYTLPELQYSEKEHCKPPCVQYTPLYVVVVDCVCLFVFFVPA